MLPSIGNKINHANLQKNFNITSSAPRSMYEHWKTFKDIVNSAAVNSNWRCCVMYFSENWINHIHNDRAWEPIKTYLHEKAWSYFEFEINRISYDIIFSMIQQKRNLKPNPYLADTAKHLFAIALGAAFSPTSRKMNSIFYEIRELDHILKVFSEELSKKDGMCADTILGQISKKISFRYFHNEEDRYQLVSPSHQIASLDNRYLFSTQPLPNCQFASDGSFLRGCVMIQVH